MITLEQMGKQRTPKIDKPDEGSLKPTRHTAKLIAVLATWAGQSIAEFMTETLDPILEEKFQRMQVGGANRPKRE